jgi:hypothetical protein
MFEPTWGEVTGEWKNYIMRSFMICTPHQIAYRVLVGDLRERDHLEDLDIDGRTI